jgi:hypothetical protein
MFMLIGEFVVFAEEGLALQPRGGGGAARIQAPCLFLQQLRRAAV